MKKDFFTASDYEILLEQNPELVEKYLTAIRNTDAKFPEDIAEQRMLFGRCESKTTGGTVKNFAESEIILFYENDFHRGLMKSFQSLLKQKNPDFDEIKQSAKILLDNGLNIHSIGYLAEHWLWDKANGKPLITTTGPNVSKTIPIYGQYLQRLLPIYANDLDAFKTFYKHSTTSVAILNEGKDEWWNLLVKMYNDRPYGFVEFLNDHIHYGPEIFCTVDIAKKVVDFFRYQELDIFDPTMPDAIKGALLNRFFFHGGTPEDIDFVFSQYPFDEAQRHIRHLFRDTGKTTFWKYMDEMQTINPKTEQPYVEPGKSAAFYSFISSILIVAEKYDLKNFFYQRLFSSLQPAVMQDYLIGASKEKVTRVINFFHHDFGPGGLNSYLFRYMAEVSYKDQPLFWALQKDKTITPDVYLNMVKRAFELQIDPDIITDVAIPSERSQSTINPQIEKPLLKLFENDSILTRIWIDSYASITEKRKTIHNVYGNKLKNNQLNDDELSWLCANEMDRFYLDQSNDNVPPLFDSLSSDTLSKLTTHPTHNLLHTLFEKNHTAGIKWFHKNHPDLFLSCVSQKNKDNKIPFEICANDYINKLEFRLQNDKNPNPQLTHMLNDFLKNKNVPLKSQWEEKIAEPKTPETPKPTEQIQPTPTIISKPEKEPKHVLSFPTFEKKSRDLSNQPQYAAIKEAIDYMTSPKFNYMLSFKDRKEAIYGDLRAHRVGEYRILYYIDFEKNKLVLIDFDKRGECYKKWNSDTKALKIFELAAKSLVNETPDNSGPKPIAHHSTPIDTQRKKQNG